MSTAAAFPPPRSASLTADDIQAVIENARPVPLHPRVARTEHRGRSFVIKKARGTDSGAEALVKERRACELASAARTADGASLCSAPVWHDATRLVFETSDDLGTLQDSLTRRWDTGPARRCGAIAAALHATAPAGLPAANPERPRLFPLRLDDYATTSDQIIAILRHIDGFPKARDALASLAEYRPTETVFVHGDFKPDNVLVGEPPGQETEPTVIDWELAGLGDPHEDLAAFLAGVLASSLHTRIRGMHAERPEEVRAAIEDSARDCFDVLGVMLDGYREVRPLDLDLTLLLLLTGSRLLCRAQSLATISSQVGPVPTVLYLAVVGLLNDLPAAAERLRAVLAEGGRA